VENYKELLLKYLKNECNADELHSICNWLNNPSNTTQIENLIKEDWEKFNIDSEGQADLSASFESLKQKLTSNPRKLTPDPVNLENNGRVRKLIMRIAAGFLLPITVGVLTYFLMNNFKRTDNQGMNEISVPLGSKTTLVLGDGTKIWLNSGSKLKYPQKFQGNFREVTLTGEAFFDVAKDAYKPFIVKTSALNIKVLGTTFNVKSYPEEGTIETTLVKGAVTITQNNLSQQKEAIYLKPNQRATYIKEEGKLVLADVEKR
jgi:ferric-dicitrate binding protein FerR (iron transport regulator)